MYFLVILVFTLNFQVAMALKYKSALIKQVQAVPSGSSPEKSIECAFKLIKADQVAAKIPGGTDSCELLHFDQLTGFEPGNEYLEKTTEIDHMLPGETVLHFLFSEVKVGDKFKFVIQKSNTDKFDIFFKDLGKNNVLGFRDEATMVTVNDKYNNVYSQSEKIQPYPFYNFQEYMIVFEVLEPHWQIYIDDVAVKTFVHRQPFSKIKKIQVDVGPAVTYLTKAFDPRLSE